MNTPASVEAELGWALGTIARSYQRVAGETLINMPGGPRSFLVLAALERGEPGTQVALAQHLGVERTMMTYLLDDMEDEGLVERRPDPADRRARRVTLTETGQSRLTELSCALHRAEEEMLAPLEPEERALLRSLLRRLATTMAPVNPCEIVKQLDAQDGPNRHPRRRRR
jgi:DNA-binding MarR family transcriptional regulator